MTSRLRLPRRTVRLRLTLVYVVLFVVSGAALLAINLAALGFSQTRVSRAAVAARPAAAPASNRTEASGAGQPSTQPQPDQNTTTSSGQINRAAAVIAAAIALGIMTVVSIALSWIVAGRVLRP